MSVPQAHLSVRVKPNASRNQVAGFKDGVLEVRIAAAPVEGKANEKLIEFLSDFLDIRKSDISIQRGSAGRHKLVVISGIDRARLDALVLARIETVTNQ